MLIKLSEFKQRCLKNLTRVYGKDIELLRTQFDVRMSQLAMASSRSLTLVELTNEISEKLAALKSMTLNYQECTFQNISCFDKKFFDDNFVKIQGSRRKTHTGSFICANDLGVLIAKVCSIFLYSLLVYSF